MCYYLNMSTLESDNHHSQLPEGILESLKELNWIGNTSDPVLVWFGEEANVFNLPKSWFTLRVPKDLDDSSKMIQERWKQFAFFHAMIAWNKLWRIPWYIRIPFIWNDFSIKTGLPEWVIVMKTVFGRTLHYHMMMKELQMNGIDTSWEIFSQYSDVELIDNFPQCKNLSRLREIDPGHAIKDLFGSEVATSFNWTLSFLSKHGLEHRDLHLWNIMLEKEPIKWLMTIYLIDYGKSSISYNKSAHLIRMGQEAYENPGEFETIWNEPWIPLLS